MTAPSGTGGGLETKPGPLCDHCGEWCGCAADRFARPPLTHVAVTYKGQVWSLPSPFRHHHIFGVISRLRSPEEDGRAVDSGEDAQGFLDASGRYLTRRQALVSAQLNNQIKGGAIIGGVLTSEDLW